MELDVTENHIFNHDKSQHAGQVHYLNNPKRAKKNMVCETQQCTAESYQICKTNVAKNQQFQSIHMFDDKSNLCEEMNFSIATSSVSSCDCVYRHQVCTKHMYNYDASFVFPKSLSLVKPLALRSESHISTLTNRFKKNKTGNTFQQHNQKCPGETEHVTSFSYYPLKYKMHQRSKSRHSLFLNSDCIKFAYPSESAAKKYKEIWSPGQNRILQCCRKRNIDGNMLPAIKRRKVDISDVCQLQMMPKPEELTLNQYCSACTNHISKFLLACKVAKMFPWIKPGQKTNMSMAQFFVKVPQVLFNEIGKEIQFYKTVKLNDSQINVGACKSQNWFVTMSNCAGNKKLQQVSSEVSVCDSVNVNQEKHEENKNFFIPSRKSERLEKKRDLGVVGPYQTDYFVEIPTVKKTKKSCRSFGNNRFWDFYSKLKKTSQYVWKSSCLRYMELMTQKPFCQSVQWSESDIRSVFGNFIVSHSSSNDPNLTSSEACPYCALPFDEDGDTFKDEHIKRHNCSDTWTLAAPVLVTQKIRRNVYSQKSMNQACLRSQLNHISKYDQKKVTPNSFTAKSGRLVSSPPNGTWNSPTNFLQFKYNPLKRATARKSRV